MKPDHDPVGYSRRSSFGWIAGIGAAGAVGAAPAMADDRSPIGLASDHGVSPQQTPEANSAALQEALRRTRTVVLPQSDAPLILDRPIEVPAGSVLKGMGIALTRIVSRAPTAFFLRSPKGTAVAQGPVFSDFTLECAGSGIRLNEEAGGFTDTQASQNYLSGARMERVALYGPGAGTAGSTGVEWNKSFHGLIHQCLVSGFDTGIRLRGSDFCEVSGRTRVSLSGTLIAAESVGSFGSGCRILGCDLLDARRSFLRSSDRHLMFHDNYLEMSTGALSGWVLDLDFVYMIAMRDNRFEVPAANGPNFLRVRGEGTSFLFENNVSNGPAWGEVEWNAGTGARWFMNPMIRQRIVARNNVRRVPVPFNTADPEPVRNGFRDLWLITPHGTGLVAANYGQDCRIRDGAFVLPPMNGYGSLIRLQDQGVPVTGKVNVHVQARATRDGQQLAVGWRDGGRTVGEAPLRLTRAAQWFTPFAAVDVSDLDLYLYNGDRGTGGEALVQAVIVERA